MHPQHHLVVNQQSKQDQSAPLTPEEEQFAAVLGQALASRWRQEQEQQRPAVRPSTSEGRLDDRNSLGK